MKENYNGCPLRIKKKPPFSLIQWTLETNSSYPPFTKLNFKHMYFQIVVHPLSSLGVYSLEKNS